MRRIFIAVLLGVLFLASSPLWVTHAQEVWQQVILNTLEKGAKAKGVSVLQVGEVSTLSSAVASATRAEVVAAPPAGSIYLRGIWIEKAATSAGLVTVSYGTGTNCATSPTTILSLAAATGQILPFGYQPIGIQVPATKALCLVTEGSDTSVRALAQ